MSNGVCSLAFDRPDIVRNKLIATCLEGKVHLWDMKTKPLKAGYAMHEQRIEKARHTVWGGRFLRQNREVRRLEKNYYLNFPRKFVNAW